MFEHDFVEWVCRFPQSRSGVAIGPGDDAALLHCSPGMLVTTDLLSEGVHFRIEEHAPERIGRKALAVSLSDIAAMGGQPAFGFVQLLLPRSFGMDFARRVQNGLFELAARFETPIAGGDTNRWDGGLVIGTTVLGSPGPGGVWKLGGARPRDRILVSGAFGGSILGHHLDFSPRVELAGWLSGRYPVHAATDVSDSLTVDLANLAEASGVAAHLVADRVPLSPAAHAIAGEGGPATGLSALDHGLTDGEDFELILAVSPADAAAILRDTGAPVPLTDIGEFLPGQGLFQIGSDGLAVPLYPSGYEH